MKIYSSRFLKIFPYLQILYWNPWVSGTVVRYSRRSPAPELCPVSPTSSKLGFVNRVDTVLRGKHGCRPTGDLGWLTQGRRWMGTQQQVQTEASSTTQALESLHSPEWFTAIYYQRQGY